MDGKLFAKHFNVIQNKKNEKQAIIEYIAEKTGILLTYEEINIDGKKIKIFTTSVKKLILQKNNIQKIVQEKGFLMTI